MRRWKSVACWYACATSSGFVSSNSPPRKVIETGVPSSRKPFGTMTAGCPVRFVARSCDPPFFFAKPADALVPDGGPQDKGIGYAASTDLVNWSAQRYLPIFGNVAGATDAWAPETFYDEAGRVAGTLTSRTGEYNLAEGLFVAQDEARIDKVGDQTSLTLSAGQQFLVNYDRTVTARFGAMSSSRRDRTFSSR